MFGHREPLEDEIARLAQELYVRRGGERGRMLRTGLEPKKSCATNPSRDRLNEELSPSGSKHV